MVGPKKPVLYAELSVPQYVWEAGPPFMREDEFVILYFHTGIEGPDGKEFLQTEAGIVKHYYGESDDRHCVVAIEAAMKSLPGGRPPKVALYNKTGDHQEVFARFYHYREAALRRLPTAPPKAETDARNDAVLRRSTTITTATIAAPPQSRWQALAGLESFGMTIVDPRILPARPKLRPDDEPRPEPQPTWDPEDLVPPITSQEYMEKITKKK